MNYKTILIGLLISFNVLAKDIVVGRVYDIAEMDEITKIELRAKKVDWNKAIDNAKNNVQKTIEDLQIELPFSTTEAKRLHVPYYIVEKEVLDKDGNVLYPKGFRYNPLNHYTLPYRLVIFDVKQWDFMKPLVKFSDRIMITSGDKSIVEKSLGREVFILDQISYQRLSIQKVPSIITQKNNLFEIKELAYNTMSNKDESK